MKRRYIIIIHVLYWFYIINQILFPMYIGKPEETGIAAGQYFKEAGIGLFLNMLTFYAIYFAFPKITASRYRLPGFAGIIVLLILVMGIRLPVGWYLWTNIGLLPEEQMRFQWPWVWNELRMVVITGIYAMLIHYLISAFEARKLKDELMYQRQAGELALLKSKINPHFLFNTLNNIYSLVYHKSAEAPEAIMRFSSIMRYVLYEATDEKVLLDKEIEYLKSYIELQKLRTKLPGLVHLDIRGNSRGIKIAPMLLIPFVENAFKHGRTDHRPAITVFLEAEDSRLRFDVFNYVGEDKHMPEKQTIGYGLQNLSRRLELIYPGKHHLSVRVENNMYKVNLVIDI
jgi:two-component system, LytTR family, sensor kinase